MYLSLMLIPALCFGQGIYDCRTYWGYTEDPITAAWNLVVDDPITKNEECIGEGDPWECCRAEKVGNCVETTAEYYRFEAYHIEHDEVVVTAKIMHPTNELEVVSPRSGHYDYRIKSCVTDTAQNNYCISEKKPWECCTGDKTGTCEDGELVEVCSDWNRSIEKTGSTITVDGKQVAGSWWVYRTISPPGGID